MQLRSGTVSQYRPIATKSFNVKGRATQPDPSNILISGDFTVQRLGRSYGVGVLSPSFGKPPTLVNAYEYETNLDQLLKMSGIEPKPQSQEFGAKKYLLLGYGPNYLYFAQAPLPTREQHPNPADPKLNQKFAIAPDTDTLEIAAMYNAPVTHGSESPSRDTAMGGSALNYAREVLDKGWAEERRWEWLHIVGHALGGNNEVGNLVAGTYDANTQMIPHERVVAELTKKAGQYNPVEVRYVVHLYPGTWIAIDIQMMHHGCGDLTGWDTFPATTMLCYDKLQYDLWAISRDL